MGIFGKAEPAAIDTAGPIRQWPRCQKQRLECPCSAALEPSEEDDLAVGLDGLEPAVIVNAPVDGDGNAAVELRFQAGVFLGQTGEKVAQARGLDLDRALIVGELGKRAPDLDLDHVREVRVSGAFVKWCSPGQAGAFGEDIWSQKKSGCARRGRAGREWADRGLRRGYLEQEERGRVREDLRAGACGSSPRRRTGGDF